MALPAVEDVPISDGIQPNIRPALMPSRPGFNVEGYREGAKTYLFLQGTFDPGMADELRLFLADLVTDGHVLVVDVEGVMLLGTIGPSGLELQLPKS
jgi:hypothetical protein